MQVQPRELAQVAQLGRYDAAQAHAVQVELGHPAPPPASRSGCRPQSAIGLTTDQFSLAPPFSSLSLASSSASQSDTRPLLDASTAPLVHPKVMSVTVMFTVMGSLLVVPSFAVTVTV